MSMPWPASQVYWTQAQTLFSDLRIPETPAAGGKNSLQDCTDEELLELAAQQAFAGNTDVRPALAYCNANLQSSMVTSDCWTECAQCSYLDGAQTPPA